MTGGPITFYYEFSSPYAYIASERIEALADRHGRALVWKPFLLGAIFKHTGAGPLTEIPLKADYAGRDIERTARLHDIPYRWPPRFPFLSVAAARLVYWAGEERAPDLTYAFFRAAFARGEDLQRSETMLAVAEAAGLDRGAAEAATRDPQIKARLADETDAAIQAGVCGAPFFLVDGEPFWGCDRMEMLDQWLETGGW
ncbi:MAG: 2-hydroxychromene-2-carboxylate isomerase [Marivibrio sp.]|uniref:2-hydroxychromene-2-carboxylate isomerase n=1 Tax=Marivibrio sp. TaxID=2039719 RepID=UPI0032EE8DA6